MDLLELRRGAQVLEQALTLPKQSRYDVEIELVEQAGRYELLNGLVRLARGSQIGSFRRI